jgi:CDGSH-type Zn-finger protein
VFPRARQYALCRCGHSAHKPFCDGAHTRVAFVGTETASRAAYSEEAKNVQGSDDVADRFECSVRIRPLLRSQRIGVETRARHRGAGPARANLMRQCGDCPSGRLVAWDNQTGKAVEAECELSIGLIEDPARRCSGPIWLRGGVRLFAADGFQYQVRNRMTLCRCGASKNKPFCDGSHQSIGFSSEG